MLDVYVEERKKLSTGIAAREKNSYKPGSQGYTTGCYQLRLRVQAENVTDKGAEPNFDSGISHC